MKKPEPRSIPADALQMPRYVVTAPAMADGVNTAVAHAAHPANSSDDKSRRKLPFKVSAFPCFSMALKASFR
jgi:hypothetical protein